MKEKLHWVAVEDAVGKTSLHDFDTAVQAKAFAEEMRAIDAWNVIVGKRKPPSYVRDDGGRAAAGHRGKTGDCVIRAISIAAGLPYQKVYDDIHALYGGATEGVPRKVYEPYIVSLGFRWVPTMEIGGGCKVHLRPEELPPGRLIVRVTRHLCAVIDGTIHDIYDPSRDGKRCVYGYFIKKGKRDG